MVFNEYKHVSGVKCQTYFFCNNNISFIFMQTAGPFEETGMVMGVLDKAFDVFILKFGVTKRVYCDVSIY